ncbi:MAG: hypothetical protein K2G67_01610 [Muribaculaceae bacterium]|nr:hypothetical protein [Muribaculaceae bacterium]
MISLPKTPRTYFDNGCHEYSTYPIQSKVLDIGYATWYGHDIMDDIGYILDNYPYVSELDIQMALWAMMAYVNNVDPADIFVFDRNNKIATDVEILLEDLMRLFRLPEGDREKAYLAEDPRSIQLYELRSMNGWETAIEEDRPAGMFSDGHWVMFPGDGPIVRNFNTNRAMQDCAYPSYVYPEPWYGNPTKAKVIILGNETRYDDFISRIQNLILQENPRKAEGVRVVVDSWLKLGISSFYLPGTTNDDIDPTFVGQLDPYNSPSYRFWLSEIRALADKLDIEPDGSFYDKIAVINANPYPSIGADPLSTGMLPSYYFLRQLVRYITNHDNNVKFILPSESLRSVWRTILADVYTDLVAFGRMIVLNKDSSKSLTKHIKRSQIEILKDLLI